MNIGERVRIIVKDEFYGGRIGIVTHGSDSDAFVEFKDGSSHFFQNDELELVDDRMYLIHESTIKNPDGVIDIVVYVVRGFNMKRYEYHIGSAAAEKKFHRMYRKGRRLHGRALAILNKFKIDIPDDDVGDGTMANPNACILTTL